ncbi:NAD(P)/FAD-dependent oxidoreductase [Marinospirillum alkaliphilum]|uniref:Glycine/D-amino acid oxidase n=1 Tax=Marinospirillum alkaliphilum DSM 21637 TaxID=1122209 RepID=A0A1K1U3Z0_9GAMM|nr:FAD-binding oxidoreductase [Marinospirillum alkaliphilum]SFX07091.1 Glycine/D-amino acid oxidase [Marinospirillum alkaliphilum DSM 21637]
MSDHVASWYAATANSHQPWPQLAEALDVQVCVLGGGFTGVNTALELAERGFSVVLLEAHRIGWGASGRNGGELIRGIGHGLEQFAGQIGQEGILQFKQMGFEAVDIVKRRIQRFDIQCDYRPGYADLATRPSHLHALEEDLKDLQSLGYPHQLKLLDASELKQQVVKSDFYVGGLVDEGSGHLHPLNLVLGEAEAAAGLGVRIFEQSAVQKIHKGERPRVETALGSVTCDRLVIAANGYLDPDLEPWLGGKLLPAGSYILVTEPLGDEQANALMPGGHAVADLRVELDYYRFTPDQRLLFGGLCTYSGKDLPDPSKHLLPHLHQVFPQLLDVKVAYQWGGMLGIGANRLPQVGHLPDCPSIHFAQAYAGHGLNASHMTARVLAEAFTGETRRYDLFASVRHMTFPGGKWLRGPLLAAGMSWYRIKDRFGS